MNAIIELNPDALSIAAAMDRERKEKGPRGPLHGIPVLIKDNIDTADKMMTTAGSLALRELAPGEGFDGGAKAARCRRGDSGEDESERVGEYSFEPFDQRMERARRADEESVCAGSESLRVEFGLGRGGVGESARGGDRDGNGRVDRVPVVDVRHCGIKPTVGLVSRTGIIPISHTPGYGGADVRGRCATRRFYWGR